MATKEIGLAIIGSGRIGTLRAKLAAGHPAVRFIAVSDRRSRQGAQARRDASARTFHSGDNDAVIARPEVNAVIVSTSEGEHLEPILAAIELGKPVLVEKPIALTLGDADQRGASDRETHGANVRVAYSRRYKERYLIAKEQILQGRIGTHYRRRRAASTIRARRPSRSSSAIRTPPRWSTRSPTTST